MGKIDQASLNLCNTANQLPPPEGPKALPVTLDFAALVLAGADPVLYLDYSNQQAKGLFSVFQSIFIDNSNNGSALSVEIESTQQTIICPSVSQGYFAVLCQNPLKLKFTSQGGVIVSVHLLNFPVAPAVWTV